MPTRLIKYLRKLGLSLQASEDDTRQFMNALSGARAVIASALLHPGVDTQGSEEANTADLAIRGMGYDPADPSRQLQAGDGGVATAVATAPQAGQRSTTVNPPASPIPPGAGGDGASAPAPPWLGQTPAGGEDPVAAERQRVQTIRQRGRDAQVPEQQIDAAIDGGHTVERATADFLAHFRNRPPVAGDFGGQAGNVHQLGEQAPAGHVRNTLTGYDAQSLLSAVLIGRCQIDDPTQVARTFDPLENRFGRATAVDTDDAHRAAEHGQRMASLPMVELVARMMRLDGVDVMPTVNSIRGAWAQRSAAMGSGTVMNVFTQAFGAVLLTAYEEENDPVDGFVLERENPNFFQQERVRMQHSGEMTLLPRGGTAEMTDIVDTKAFAKADRFAEMFVVDEQDLIDDRFDVIGDHSPMMLGAAARRLKQNLVAALLLANPIVPETGQPLFSAAHNNLITASPLSKENLQRLHTMIRLQTENEVNLDLIPRYVIAATSKEFDLDEILRNVAQIAVGGGTNERRSSFNALATKNLTPRYLNRLDNGVIEPKTKTAHLPQPNSYFMATEGDGRTIEVTYVRGSGRQPALRSYTLDRGQWGMGWDISLDIGASVIGYRGLAKAEG